MGTFHIQAQNLGWILGPEDDPHDLCLHGEVTVTIGSRVLRGDGTVSATALYLLKSLVRDKIQSEHEIQMVPCCGHFLIANEDCSEVTIIGCDTGLDWSILHREDKILLVLPDGVEEWVNPPDYRAEVYRFADQIEAYYAACKPKVLPDDAFERNGYIAFWNEWHRLRNLPR